MASIYTGWQKPSTSAIHRPCGYATLMEGKRGRIKRVYAHVDYRTPFEKFRSLRDCRKALKPGITEAFLDRIAGVQTDLAPAQQMPSSPTYNLNKGQKDHQLY